MPNLIERLDALSEALDNAAPGPLFVVDDNDNSRHSLWTVQNADFNSSDEDALAMQAAIHYGCKADADAIVLSVNFLREHGPTLREALRDAERIAYLTEDIADRGERAKRNELLARMSVMSHSAACMAIDTAIDQERGDRLGRDGGG